MQHQMPFETGEEEQLLWVFSGRQVAWLALGIVLSYQLSKAFPVIPGLGIWGGLYYLIPLGITALFAFVKKNDMFLLTYLQLWWEYRHKTRKLYFD